MIYHILTEEAWAAARAAGVYHPASLDSEGFIHASKLEQVAGSLDNYFKGVPHLLLLHIDERRLKARLVWENTVGGSIDFPHIYGPLNLDAVVEVRPARP